MEGGMADVDDGLAGARSSAGAAGLPGAGGLAGAGSGGAGRGETGAVEVRGLTKTFGRVTAVREMTFAAPAGKVTGFLGPNGSGKTTTLRMVLGLVRPDAGEALIGGVRYGRLARPRRSVGALLEATSFHPGRRARDHLRVLADAAQVPTRRVDEVLDQVDLASAARRRVREFSLGMRQRLGLAAALLGDPQVLLLDEPANGLDPAGIAWLRGLLRTLADEGRTVVVASHVLSEVAQTADHVVIVNAGELRFAGPLHELGGSAALESAFLRLTAVPG
jgi:ABC-2 type transport system ATP-binding protein